MIAAVVGAERGFVVRYVAILLDLDSDTVVACFRRVKGTHCGGQQGKHGSLDANECALEPTYAMSNGVAGWDPPIVCAKLVAPTPCCLACTFERPGPPLAGAPKPQLVVLPRSRSVSGQRRVTWDLTHPASNCFAISPNLEECFGFEGAVGLHSLGMAGWRG